ncbi:hypothetical protein E2C01_086282 [Portunus trituberculatus]|uniref:Uncharacterized protein n=1 Tax=Portunus trituberculatus TaxID=210409 RepID=A0A5B7JE60_PORTR|nr:hypothetical protein [Portunus trituberculatus]
MRPLSPRGRGGAAVSPIQMSGKINKASLPPPPPPLPLPPPPHHLRLSFNHRYTSRSPPLYTLPYLVDR